MKIVFTKFTSLAVLIMIMLTFVLVGCGQKQEDASASNDVNQESSQQASQAANQQANQEEKDDAAAEKPASSKKAIPLKDLEGIWETGTMTITEVDVPEDIRKKAEAEKDKESSEETETAGCDYDTIKYLDENKGKPMPSKLGIFPIDDKSGYLSITMVQEDSDSDNTPKAPEDDEDKKNSTFTYENNTITMSLEEKGLTGEVILEASQDGGSMLEGTYKLSAENGKAKVTLKLSYKK